MRLAWIAIVTWLLASGASAATIRVDTDFQRYDTTPGNIVTVIVTLTIVSETVNPFSAFGVSVGWDPTVVKVQLTNPPVTFGKSAQTPIIPGLSGSPTPSCVSAGANKGKSCAVITQSRANVNPLPLAGFVVIGALLLEVVPGAVSGDHLGLTITGYNNNGVIDPALDPNLTLTDNFRFARLVAIPEPATVTQLALGLIGLGLAARRRSGLS